MPWEVGDRVLADCDRGTVKYVGSVDGMPGEWLGIDWERAERGKHDGSHKGRRYFTAAQPTSGSFLRPDKARGGCDLMSAVRERYGGHDEATESFEGHKAQGMASKEILFVGMDMIEEKQREPGRLRVAVVDWMAVSRAGEEAGTMGRLRELDLTANLLADWPEVARLVAALPALTALNISRNVMKPWPANEAGMEGGGSERLRELLANACGLDSQHWLALTSRFSQLESLSVSTNRLTSLPLPSVLPKLGHLDLSLNPLNGWEEVAPLATLPSLTLLNLMAVGLERIQPITSTSPFPSLHTLYLNGNKLREWSDIYALNVCPKLSSLVLEPNPVMQSEFRTTARQFILAELPNLKTLDREEVEAKEVRGSEIDYLKRLGKDWLASQASPEAAADFARLHPRYAALVDKYGAPEAVEMEIETKAAGGVLSSGLLNITFRYGDKSAGKALPGSMMVRGLGPMARRLFKLPPRSRLAFAALPQERPEVQVPLDNDERELSFYAVQDKDEILVTLLQ